MLPDTDLLLILVSLFLIYTSVHPLCLTKSVSIDTAIGFPAQHPACGRLLRSRFLGIILPVQDFFTHCRLRLLPSHSQLSHGAEGGRAGHGAAWLPPISIWDSSPLVDSHPDTERRLGS